MITLKVLLPFLLYLIPLISAQELSGYIISIHNQSLQGTYIGCPLSQACAVACYATASCQNATIGCPIGHSCEVYCLGESSCLGATILGRFTFNNSTFSVDCATTDSCRSATIIGGQASKVYVSCYGESSCRSAVINASTSSKLTLGGCGYPPFDNACIGMNISCPNKRDGVPMCILFCMYFH